MILLKVVNSDGNSIILYPRIVTSRFKGQDLLYLISKTFKLLFKTKTKKKKIDFLKISNCPDPINVKYDGAFHLQ